MSSGPKTVTIYGRLSFPSFTAVEAYERSLKGSYPSKDVASTSPDFLLLVNQTQWEKFHKHAVDTFLPYCVEQHRKGEKKDALEQKEAAALAAGLDDLESQTFNSPAKPVHEKSAPLAPEAVATIKVIGQKGVDFDLRAIVLEEGELKVPDPDIKVFPVVKPIGQTVHEMYPGAVVAVTLNLYSYHNGKHPGFSAGASTAVFKADAERFGGSLAIDEDAIFLD
jgi:hypothetical protein